MDGIGRAFPPVAEMWRAELPRDGMGTERMGTEMMGWERKGFSAVAEMWRRNFQGTGSERTGTDGIGVERIFLWRACSTSSKPKNFSSRGR